MRSTLRGVGTQKERIGGRRAERAKTIGATTTGAETTIGVTIIQPRRTQTTGDPTLRTNPLHRRLNQRVIKRKLNGAAQVGDLRQQTRMSKVPPTGGPHPQKVQGNGERDNKTLNVVLIITANQKANGSNKATCFSKF